MYILIDTVDLVVRERNADAIAGLLGGIAGLGHLVWTCRDHEWTNYLRTARGIAESQYVMPRLDSTLKDQRFAGLVVGTQLIVEPHSYAAGEGAGEYLPGTDSVHPRCHRSNVTHVAQLFGGDRTRNFACSGAVQHHLFAPFPGRMQMTSQVEEMSRADMALDASFLSIGGNDIGFGDIVTRCLFPNRIPEPSLLSVVVGAPVWKIVDNECGVTPVRTADYAAQRWLAGNTLLQHISVGSLGVQCGRGR